ncbi:hypothetical protein AKO1_010962 [Acrasis kona]|uniref:Uncharacterized protein n=1 Tax=Acrasis kona TaxID=1008807 RepID=A0AAW2YQM9_9EUKA
MKIKEQEHSSRAHQENVQCEQQDDVVFDFDNDGEQEIDVYIKGYHPDDIEVVDSLDDTDEYTTSNIALPHGKESIINIIASESIGKNAVGDDEILKINDMRMNKQTKKYQYFVIWNDYSSSWVYQSCFQNKNSVHIDNYKKSKINKQISKSSGGYSNSVQQFAEKLRATFEDFGNTHLLHQSDFTLKMIGGDFLRTLLRQHAGRIKTKYYKDFFKELNEDAQRKRLDPEEHRFFSTMLMNTTKQGLEHEFKLLDESQPTGSVQLEKEKFLEYIKSQGRQVGTRQEEKGEICNKLLEDTNIRINEE